MKNHLKIPLERNQSIKNNKVTFVKNCIDLNNTLDFNLLISFIEKSDTDILIKGDKENMLKSNMQIKKVENNFQNFKEIFDNVRNDFDYSFDKRDEGDLFFSFKSNPGNTHVDGEDVFIFGLYGITVYKIIDQNNSILMMEKGDMLFIPKGIPHKVISLSERIVLSLGLFGERRTTID